MLNKHNCAWAGICNGDHLAILADRHTQKEGVIIYDYQYNSTVFFASDVIMAGIHIEGLSILRYYLKLCLEASESTPRICELKGNEMLTILPKSGLSILRLLICPLK